MQGTTYLEMTIGAYRLAVRTDRVTAVQQEVDVDPVLPEGGGPRGPVSAEVKVRGVTVPLVDLRGDASGEMGSGSIADVVPFVVGLALAGDGGTAVAVAADRIDYVGAQHGLPVRLPAFGLRNPELFEGAVRHGDDLLLILAPGGVAALARVHNEFDPARKGAV